ncbi:hypothetical protein KBK19_07145 [Microvirga sp. STR05]|uniref:Uncharacterized protein n=1 Tax=Hymenobacter duratus TaxID=2771356 RepID=A0ABR8JHD8_9BACT|nr:hypothetical protein [Hymenobacter duratus]MBD2714805.1 hypothetical protein [Hymenobacter duratus]MBR7949710.1 hypothetical protein [Microvirga sp. STR05]
MKLYSVLACRFLAVLLLSGCQGAHVATLLPRTASYAPAPVSQADDSPVAAASDARPVAAATPAEPVLLASTAATAAPMPAPSIGRPLAPDMPRQQFVQALPDTSRVQQQPNGPTAEQIKEADKRTTTVNIFGVLLLLLGLGLLIGGISVGGWGGLALFVYGFVPLILSIPLMIFRSKNSTRRLASEKLKAERKAARNK